MNKHFTLRLVILSIMATIFLNCKEKYDFLITLHNFTGSKIKNLSISFDNNKFFDVPILDNDKKYSMEINLDGMIGEDAMFLNYTDNKGNKQRISIVGYFEKYEKKLGVNATINFKSIDNNGVLEITTYNDLYD